jgi:hypothetical protein
VGARGQESEHYDVVSLSYRATTVTLVAQDCAAPVGVAVSPAGRSWVLSTATRDALEGATFALDAGNFRAPSFIGLPFVAARRAANRLAPDSDGVVGEVQDAQEPLGSVVWQEPLPGVLADTRAVSLLVAVGPAPRCRSTQLAGRYLQGGVGTGDLFGSIVLFDTSRRPCRVSGHVTLTGLDSHDHPDTVSTSGLLEPPLTLSPRATGRLLDTQPIAVLAATFGFAAEVRDDPTVPGGICYGHETYPSAWSLRLTNEPAVRVPNGGPGSGGRFYTCHGSFSIGKDAGFQLYQ